jgi:hypothetical protein
MSRNEAAYPDSGGAAQVAQRRRPTAGGDRGKARTAEVSASAVALLRVLVLEVSQHLRATRFFEAETGIIARVALQPHHSKEGASHAERTKFN